MDELRRLVDGGGKLVQARRDITPRQLYGLGLFLAAGVTVGCLTFGVDPQVALGGGLGALVAIVLIAALSDRG